MENRENVVYKKDFENRKRYLERQKRVAEKNKEIAKGYESDIANYKIYCIDSQQEESLESFLDYLYVSVVEKRLKKTSWEKRLVAVRRYFEARKEVKVTEYFEEQVTAMRKIYYEDGQEELIKLGGKMPVDKEKLLARLNQLGTREKAICLVNLITANRPSEMVRLRIEDFDLEDGNVSVFLKKQKSWHTKRITSEVIHAVRLYIEEYNLKQKDYFVGRVYKHGRFESCKVSETSYRGMLKRWIGLSPYNFRKTQVTSMHQAGADLSTIAEQTGHKSLVTLDKHYLKVTNKRVDKYL